MPEDDDEDDEDDAMDVEDALVIEEPRKKAAKSAKGGITSRAEATSLCALALTVACEAIGAVAALTTACLRGTEEDELPSRPRPRRELPTKRFRPRSRRSVSDARHWFVVPHWRKRTAKVACSWIRPPPAPAALLRRQWWRRLRRWRPQLSSAWPPSLVPWGWMGVRCGWVSKRSESKGSIITKYSGAGSNTPEGHRVTATSIPSVNRVCGSVKCQQCFGWHPRASLTLHVLAPDTRCAAAWKPPR